MIERGFVLFAVVAALASAGCAGPGAAPAAVPSRAVPPGCDPTAAEVNWADFRQEPRLSRASRLRTDVGEDGMAVEEVLKGPFTPRITGVAAPVDWIPALAESLSAEAGVDLRSGPAPLPENGDSFDFGGDASIKEFILYDGVRSASATFTVVCDDPPLQGAFTSWTTASSGVAACSPPQPGEDPFAALARAYCTAIPAPAASSDVPPVAIPFGEDDFVGE
ncbi:hypothetical protein [Actinoplanes sp. NPDC049802]|uniref:hypothetical protein n=1 Tax=Actinoplanes sp. NPDC049802 TaxID=3154742 RepID=UPI00340E3ABD